MANIGSRKPRPGNTGGKPKPAGLRPTEILGSPPRIQGRLLVERPGGGKPSGSVTPTGGRLPAQDTTGPRVVPPTPVKPKPATGGNGGGSSSPKPPAGPGKKPSKKPKPGYQWKLVNGKWKQVKKKGFIDNEIQSQINQDAKLTQFLTGYNSTLYDQMKNDANHFSSLASQYDPLNAQHDAAAQGSGNAQSDQWASLFNGVGSAQQNALAAEMASRGNNGLQLLGNMNSSAKLRHQEYARNLRKQRTALKMQYQAQQADAALKQMQMDLAAKQFGVNTQFKYDSLNAQQKHYADVLNQGDRHHAQDLEYKYRNQNAKMQFGAKKAAAAALASMSKDQRKRVDALRKELFGWDKVTGTDGSSQQVWRRPKKQFRTAMGRLMELGVRTRDAAALAARWSMDSDTQNGKPITFKKGHAMGFYRSLINRGVKPGYAQALTAQYYPGFRPSRKHKEVHGWWASAKHGVGL